MTPTRDRVARVPTLIVHGGAGANPDEGLQEFRDGVRAAVQAGWRVLGADGSALDAVEAAVRSLEDHPRFNAGRGSARAGDIQPTGISTVEDAKPIRPRQSTRINPPSPRPSSTSRSTATLAA